MFLETSAKTALNVEEAFINTGGQDRELACGMCLEAAQCAVCLSLRGGGQSVRHACHTLQAADRYLHWLPRSASHPRQDCQRRL